MDPKRNEKDDEDLDLEAQSDSRGRDFTDQDGDLNELEEIEHSPMQGFDEDGMVRSARERHSLLPPSLPAKDDFTGFKSI